MPRRSLAALTVLTVLGGALRLATVGVQSYWLDEAVTVGLVRRGLGSMLGAIPHSESTPPLYYVLAWPWARIFGTSEWGLRSLSVVFGTALIPLAYVIAARLGSRRAGLVAAALVAANPLLIWYSQEARAYALLALLCGVSLWSFLRVLDGGGGRWIAAWALGSAAALATHYFALFPVAGEALWLVLRTPRTRALLGGLAVVAVVGAGLGPLAVNQSSDDRAGFITASPLPHRAVQAAKQFLVGYHAPDDAVLTAVALLCAAVALALLVAALRGPRPPRAAPVAAVFAAAGVVPLLLAVAGADYLIARNLLAAWLPLGVLLALGIGASPRWGLLAAAGLCAAGLAAFVGVETHRADQRSDWRGAARALGPPDRPRLIISDSQSARVLALYLKGARPLHPGDAPPVDEIDLLGVPSRAPGEPSALTPTGTIPAGFSAARTVRTSSYSAARWRAAALHRLPARDLAYIATDKTAEGILYQPVSPGGGR